MAPYHDLKRPVRVAGSSGGFSDRVQAISRLAANEDVDVIVGDWLSELTMTIHGTGKVKVQEKLGGKSLAELSWDEQLQNAMFAENFMDCFEPAIDDLARRGIKLAVNAGASDTEVLAKYVQKKVQEKGYNLKVAWIEGDDATGAVKKLLEGGEEFRSTMHNRSVKEWGLEPVCAQAYVGGLVSFTILNKILSILLTTNQGHCQSFRTRCRHRQLWTCFRRISHHRCCCMVARLESRRIRQACRISNHRPSSRMRSICQRRVLL
jgi:hypothetical protein